MKVISNIFFDKVMYNILLYYKIVVFMCGKFILISNIYFYIFWLFECLLVKFFIYMKKVEFKIVNENNVFV